MRSLNRKDITEGVVYGIIEEVKRELQRQWDWWRERNHPPWDWLMILAEEIGEANKAVLELKLTGHPNPHYFDYRQKLIQVAAVAISAVESLDRGKWRDNGEENCR